MSAETNQERLEQIQQACITDVIEYGCQYGSRSKVKTDEIVKDVKWLIEQAERTQSVEEENTRLREALAFYADRDVYRKLNYNVVTEKHFGDIDMDLGLRARRVLQAVPER